jgi:hypothetical protein
MDDRTTIAFDEAEPAENHGGSTFLLRDVMVEKKDKFRA